MKKVAVLGAGYWGKNLVRNLHQLGALKSICDADSNILSNFRADYPSIEMYSEFEQILNDDEIEGVVIALPAEFHYKFAIQTLLHHKDVYVEKPLALHVEHAKEMINLAEKQKRVSEKTCRMMYYSGFHP